MNDDEYLRGVHLNQNRTLEVAHHHWTNPHTGRRIALLGLIHLAEESYYAQMRRLVDGLQADGFTIHQEGGRDPEPGAFMLPEERQALEQQDKDLATAYSELCKLYEVPWVAQRDTAMNKDASWEYHDISALDLARLMGSAHGGIGVAPMASQLDAVTKVLAEKGKGMQFRMMQMGFVWGYVQQLLGVTVKPNIIQRTLGRLVRPAAAPTKEVLELQARMAAMSQYMLGYRECLAALAALATHQDVAMLWHPAHFRGIIPILERNGFERRETFWTQAISNAFTGSKVQINMYFQQRATESAPSPRH